jgi:choline dehydrogenase-like flavoprotein
LSDNELASFPCATAEMRSSYAAVATRIGISGGVDDDMSDYFGLDAWAGPAIGLDEPHDYLHRHYAASKSKLQRFGFTMGRSRVAVLSEDLNGRKACSKSGNCLWGCQRGALYTAADELIALRKFPNFRIQHGFVVKRVTKEMDTWTVEGLASNGTESRAVTAPKVLLAAGTLATTRLALDALRSNAPVPLLSCPTAAFLLWLPRLLGAQRKAGFGLGQLSYHLKLSDGTNGFGSTFSATGIPVSEFVRHLPLRRRLGIDILQNLLSSCLVGNIFLPGHFSMAQAKLEGDGSLAICGGYNTVVPDLMKEAASTLRSAYQKIGAIMLPMSFTPGRPGGDIHYAGTFPMKMKPIEGETNFLGELCGLSGLHVIDGACLPILSEKSHTLTIMANAHRIAAQIGQELRDELANARSRQ